jgi:hypothetical protein
MRARFVPQPKVVLNEAGEDVSLFARDVRKWRRKGRDDATIAVMMKRKLGAVQAIK